MKNNLAKKILLQLSGYLKIPTNRGLAEFFGVPESKLYSWRKHGRITDTGKILAVLPNISLEWLETGEGSMFVSHSEKILPDGRRILTATNQQTYNMQGDEKVGGDKVLTASNGSAAISAGGQVTNTQRGNKPTKALEADELSAMEKTFLQILRRRPDGEELLEHYLSEVLKPYGS